jgi:hypothetical protein
MLWLEQTMQVLRAQMALWVLKLAIQLEPRVQPRMAREARLALKVLTAKAPAAQAKTVQLPRAARVRTVRMPEQMLKAAAAARTKKVVLLKTLQVRTVWLL